MTAATDVSNRRSKIKISKSLSNNLCKSDSVYDKNTVPLILFCKSQSCKNFPASNPKKNQENQRQVHKQEFIPTKNNIYLQIKKVCMKVLS